MNRMLLSEYLRKMKSAHRRGLLGMAMEYWINYHNAGGKRSIFQIILKMKKIEIDWYNKRYRQLGYNHLQKGRR